MEERMTFKVFDDNGKEIECEVLFTFESDETGKNYKFYYFSHIYTFFKGNSYIIIIIRTII